jgi:hypothetical protein
MNVLQVLVAQSAAMATGLECAGGHRGLASPVVRHSERFAP